jgi:hypothetical protein
MFNRVNRLEIQTVMLVFSNQLLAQTFSLVHLCSFHYELYLPWSYSTLFFSHYRASRAIFLAFWLPSLGSQKSRDVKGKIFVCLELSHLNISWKTEWCSFHYELNSPSWLVKSRAWSFLYSSFLASLWASQKRCDKRGLPSSIWIWNWQYCISHLLLKGWVVQHSPCSFQHELNSLP